VTAYEELRHAALEEADHHARRAAGLAILLRTGITAWMRACRRVPGPVASAAPASETMRAIPGTIRDEVSVLLAEMALAAAAENIT
jgi:hypothetical protein